MSIFFSRVQLRKTFNIKIMTSKDRFFATKVEVPKLRDQSLLRQSAFVNGEWVKSKTGQEFSVLDPATNDEIGKIPDMNPEDAKEAIRAAKEAFKDWAKQTAKHRHDLLKTWYSLILDNKDDLATILTRENGKQINEALGEIKYGASFIEWFAEEARRVYGDVIPSPWKNHKFVVQKQPVGVVGIITPWNFPNAMITRKLGAALAVGCTTVIKPDSQTPFSALALAELASRAGFPKGVINVVTAKANTPGIGLELTTNPDVRKISFTGSTTVGKLLMQQSSSTIKKLSLELGGNAPFIVFDDADIDAAVEGLSNFYFKLSYVNVDNWTKTDHTGAMASKFRASGQTCVCANRIYVQSSIHAEFASRLAEKVSKFRIGNGFDPQTTHGPLINSKAVEKVTRHVEDAVAKGAEILVGGVRRDGNFFEPTVLTGMTTEMAITSEETFGPVAGLYKFESEEEVIELANDSTVGLAGYFYSRDVGRCWRVAEALELGMVGVNSGIVGSSEVPFGGIKESGLGREGSKYGIDEYLNIKYINFGGI
ncbi:8703_t:CDS:2 [Acaulospora morrowiae]|uniref:Succinate-semialdehyde dehydrogenase, mitochondrial n=1 Tax=Acaulospora morrowiae TaxID=94023 RepID=A0A9N9C1S2_9GLOM|nr:8703_t:CDS:2 [Acaulospora morrowiae]